MNAVMVIPFRSDDTGYRQRNLEFVLKIYSAKKFCDIVVVEQSALPTALALSGARHIHLPDAGSFNRSRCRNTGVRQSPETPWIIWSDGDVIHPHLESRMPADSSAPMFINPKNVMLDLSDQQTRHLIQTGDTSGRSPTRLGVCGASGLCILNRKTFEITGGMDERFLGWGGEDDAFDCLCQTLGGISCFSTNDRIYHLWHPRDRNSLIHDEHQYRKNLDLVNDCRRDVRQYQRDRGVALVGN